VIFDRPLAVRQGEVAPVRMGAGANRIGHAAAGLNGPIAASPPEPSKL